MKQNKPLLSIAIATKNREAYCIAAIQSILNYNDERIEIAIADNSETEQVKEYVETINSPYIKYCYNNSNISSIDNFNMAIELTTGDYVMLIGDDDSILPNAIELAKWGKENDIDSISAMEIYTYFWAGADPNFPHGLLKIPFIKNTSLIQGDPYSTLLKLLKNGIVNYSFYPLPKSYHGLVKKSIMNQVKKMTGNFYGGLSPDIFSVISISLLSKSHYISGVPFSIAGVCPSSTTSDQIKGKHCGPLENMPHLKNRKTPYIWDRLVPRFYSVTTTWGDSALNALSAMNRDDLKMEFNVYPLLSQSILMNRKTLLNFSIKQIETLRKELSISGIYFWCRVGSSSAVLVLDKIFRMVKNKLAKQKQIEGVESIFEAIELIRKDNKLWVP